MTQSKLRKFHYDLVIEAENQQQADRVMIERVGFNEDLREYGVSDYTIDASPVDGREPDPIDFELHPVISTAGPVTSVNGAQYPTLRLLNAVIGAGDELPHARHLPGDEENEALELVYRVEGTTYAVQIEADGSFRSMSRVDFTNSELVPMDGSPLYGEVVAALAGESQDTGVLAEDRPVIPGFERHGAVAGVNEDEYRSIMRINAAIDGSYTLPSAERVYTGDGTPLLEFAYRRPDGWLHVRVKTDGSFHSADVACGKDLVDLTSGPLYDSITAALESQDAENGD